MHSKIVAGNWKMNKTFQEAEDLTEKITEALERIPLGKVEVVLCPPAPYLEMVLDLTDETHVAVGAQNVNDHDYGAYTGEISAPMLRSMEIEYCIVGHSERRKYYHESDELLTRKMDELLKYDIIPIFCCGELLTEREADRYQEVVRIQLEQGVFHLDETDFRKVVIAYEPVWAIGTGVNATPEQAQEMHAYIRQLIETRYNPKAAEDAIILYGGSCNAQNARSLFSQPDIDGGLIGGASLKADEFVSIVQIAVDCS